MNRLEVGFARKDITPKIGIDIVGYYIPRIAEGVLDPLEVIVLALSCGQAKVLILAVDNLGIKKTTVQRIRQSICKNVGIPAEAIFLHATHTHTGPRLEVDSGSLLNAEYYEFVLGAMIAASSAAIADLKPATMGYGVGNAPNIAFVRRFRMSDGTVKTNPGVNNADIIEPIGIADECVNVIRFKRADDSIVLANMGLHPDTVGGSLISADWPGFVRKTVEMAIPDAKCIFVNGAQGDINHVNVHPKDGDMNDMFVDFDDVARGYGHARYIGRVISGAILQIYDKVAFKDTDYMNFGESIAHIASNMGNPEQLSEAIRINEHHETNRDDLIPYSGMMLTTVVAEAARIVRLANGPAEFELPMSAIIIGDLALIGIPGEPFSGIATELKKTSGYGAVLPICIMNGFEGYFPMQEAYNEGGYEARSSNFKPGVAELLIEEGKKLLYRLKQ